MGPAFYIISILGCADGSQACTPVATVPTRYETASTCSAATGQALLDNSDFDFPTIVAECRGVKAPASAADERPERIPADAMKG